MDMLFLAIDQDQRHTHHKQISLVDNTLTTMINDNPELTLRTKRKSCITNTWNLIELLSQITNFFQQFLRKFGKILHLKSCISKFLNIRNCLNSVDIILQLWCIKIIKKTIYQIRQTSLEMTQQPLSTRKYRRTKSFACNNMLALFHSLFYKVVIIKECHQHFWSLRDTLEPIVLTFREHLLWDITLLIGNTDTRDFVVFGFTRRSLFFKRKLHRVGNKLLKSSKYL